MQSATFLGEVRSGALHISQPLTAFDGMRVFVTLIAPGELLGHNKANGVEEHRPAELEIDLYAPIPAREEQLGSPPVRTVVATPCLIFPEITDDA